MNAHFKQPIDPASLTRDDCEAMDAADTLAPIRDRFVIPRHTTSAPDAPDLIYLDGNSLGPLPACVAGRVRQCVEDQWGGDLVSAWNSADWVNLPSTVAAKIAPLIGADPANVRVTNSTSVNLFKVLAAALALRPGRRRIVSQRHNFPTDLYMVEGLASLMGGNHELVLVEDAAAIEAAIDGQTALVMLTEIDYRTGLKLDMKALTKVAHRAGALTVWDLAHSAGAFPVHLADCEVDFAVGCGYKYLNGGPGAPSFLFVAPRHQAEAQNPLSGWFAHAAPFAFECGFRPADGADRFLAGTPPVISMVALDAALDLWADVSIDDVREKSTALTDLFIALIEHRCPKSMTELEMASPRNAALRGSQVSLRHEHAYPIVKCLIARGVIGDFRAAEPGRNGIARFGFTPLYTRFTDVWDAVERIADVLETRSWDVPEFRSVSAVT